MGTKYKKTKESAERELSGSAHQMDQVIRVCNLWFTYRKIRARLRLGFLETATLLGFGFSGVEDSWKKEHHDSHDCEYSGKLEDVPFESLVDHSLVYLCCLVAVVLDYECVDASVGWLIREVASVYIFKAEDCFKAFFIVQEFDSFLIKQIHVNP